VTGYGWIGYWLLVIGVLVIGYWLLVIGYWVAAKGRKCRLKPVHFAQIFFDQDAKG